MHPHRHQDFIYYDFRPNRTPKANKPISKRCKTNKITQNTPAAPTCSSHPNNNQTQPYVKQQLAVRKSKEVDSSLAAMQRAVSTQQSMFQRFCLGEFIHSNHRTYQILQNHTDLFQRKPSSHFHFFAELHCDPEENPLFCEQTASDLQKTDAPVEVELDYDVSAYFTD